MKLVLYKYHKGRLSLNSTPLVVLGAQFQIKESLPPPKKKQFTEYITEEQFEQNGIKVK